MYSAALKNHGAEEWEQGMAAFARGPDITVRLCDVIEYLQGDSVLEQAESHAMRLLNH